MVDRDFPCFDTVDWERHLAHKKPVKLVVELSLTVQPPQPFYGPFSVTTWVSRWQKRTSGLYGARED